MAKRQQTTRPTTSRDPIGSPDSASGDADIPVVGMREPCPCGSGRRYKACHGRQAAHAGLAFVSRPFAGLAAECDLVALREIVPAATAPLTLRPGVGTRPVTVATVLPMAWPALVRADEQVYLGLQVPSGSGDPSRDLAEVLLRALEFEPGDSVPPPVGLPGPGPRLQDLIEPDAALDITVHDGFNFWVPDVGELSPDVAASLERANAGVVPTARLTSVTAAYWSHIGRKEHLRWVLPQDEEPLLDAFARLHVRGADLLGPDTRFIGSFRAHGMLVPVWDLAPGTTCEQVEEPAAAYESRLLEALADSRPLTVEERRARAGLLNRQLTLR